MPTELEVALYGASRVPDVQATPVQPAEQTAEQAYVPPTPVRAAPAMLQTASAQEGIARAAQVDNEVTATAWESFTASAADTALGRAVQLWEKPKFVPDQNFDPVEFTNNVEFPLQEGERNELLQSKSAAEAKWWKENIQKQRMLQQAMQDNRLTSLVPQFLDPAYLALDAASLGTARVLRMGRVGAGLTAAGASAAFDIGVGSQVVPLSTEELVLNAAFNGIGTAVAYRAGKVEPMDPKYPGDQLGAGLKTVVPEPSAGEYIPSERPVTASQPGRTSEVFEPAVQGGLDMAPKLQFGGGRQWGYVVDEVGNRIKTSEKVLEVDSVEDIATYSRGVRAGRSIIDPSAKAVYLPDDDKVFIVKQNLKPGDDLKGILLHEVGVHMNLERVLGTEQFLRLLDDFENAAKAGDKAAVQAYKRVPKDTPNHLVREEALGYFVEANHRNLNNTVTKRLVTAVRQFLRKLGLTLKYTHDDIVGLVRKAAAKRNLSTDTTFPYVWHGSPVKGIDELDLAYVGSGEGGSMFGYGHYVTSEKGTALDYRNKEAVRRGIAPEDGGLYRLKVKVSPDELLNWDSAAQSGKVAAALKRLGISGTGEQVYRQLEKQLGSEKAASEFLLGNGVQGIKYATGRTRYTGGQNSNYVLFSNNALEMAVRYSKPAAPESVEAAVTALAKDPKLEQLVGKKSSWSWHKSMQKYSSKAADLLLQDPLDLTKNSASAEKDVTRRMWTRNQKQFEDAFLEAMKDRGMGVTQRIFQWGKGREVRNQLQREIAQELAARADAQRNGLQYRGADEAVAKLADLHDKFMQGALRDAKAAGVTGADKIEGSPGYFSRRWDFTKFEDVMRKFPDTEQGKQALHTLLERGVKRANPDWDDSLVKSVSTALFERARAKSYYEDAGYVGHMGVEAVIEVRNMLDRLNIPFKDRERVLEFMVGKVDEAGKPTAFKSRIAVDSSVKMTLPDGSEISYLDLIDNDIPTLLDRYADNMAGRVGLAKVGLGNASDLDKLKLEGMAGIPEQAGRDEFNVLYDDAVKMLLGYPVGENMHSFMRSAAALTQMVGLSWSGLYQIMEMAVPMAKYGFLKTWKHMLAEMPGAAAFVDGLKANKADQDSLYNILSGLASQDIRLRPVLQRFEDNFEMSIGDSVQTTLQQGRQLVPFVNGMAYVHHFAAKVTAGLIVDTLQRAAKGDAKAAETLSRYGLDLTLHPMVTQDIAKHGFSTTKWSDETMAAVLGPTVKMMDEAVLRTRLGELPHFAVASNLGKFLTTFRSFILGAHNKLMSNTLVQDGWAGLGLLVLHQLPAAMLTAKVQSLLQGKELEDEALVQKAIAQVGAFGLFSELVGIATGQRNEVGVPGMIGLDRVVGLGGSVLQGDADAKKFLNATPVIAVSPIVKALQGLEE
jgi:hypothetical protein